MPFALALGLGLAAPVAANAAVTGAVYRDYNANGARDAREPGVAGIAVTAYGDSGAAITTATSTADGTYGLGGLPAGAKVRVEFSGLPAYLKPGASGKGDGSGVRIVTDGATGVNTSVNNPADFCQANPNLALPCQRYGDAVAGEYSIEPALRTILEDGTGGFVTKTTQATIGTTYGTAWRRTSKTIYVKIGRASCRERV